MKKKFLAGALVAVMALGLAACGGSGSAKSESGAETAAAAEGGSTLGSNGSTVVVAVESGFSTLDPGYVYEKYPPLVVNACYETLFKFNGKDDAPQPSLADSYEFSEDNKTLTVKLKDGITFASGNTMTSADVAFSIMRCKNLKGSPSFMCDTIDSIDTPDDKTVVFHLNTPDSGILAKLTYASMSVLDSKVVKENGGTDAADASTKDTAQTYLNSTSAGSGMYVLTSYTKDEEIVLDKNPNYWGTATNVDKYVIKLQGDANSQMMMLSQGDVDVAMNLTDDTMAELDGTEGVATINTPTKSIGFLMMNMDKNIGGPVADPKVQQAIRKAIDYPGMRTISGSGSVTPNSFIQVGFLGNSGERPDDYRNVDEAKQLLADAGYPDGFDINLDVVSDLSLEGVAMTDFAQKVKDDLAEVGINCNIVSRAWDGGYGEDYRDGKLGFTVMYWGTDYNDPNVQLPFLPGQEVGLRAGWTADMDPELAALNDKTLNATDNDARAAVLKEIQDKTYENGPFIVLTQAPAHVGYNTRLDGVNFSDPYALDVTLINIK